MEVRNCKQCGRLFNYIGGAYHNLCPACVDKMEAKFQEVKQYVEDNPGCTMDDITENYGVSTGQIQRWIREERLCFTDDSPIGIGCEGCGKMIKSGRYCPECRTSMEKQMGSLYQSVNDTPAAPKKSGQNRMRFLDSK
jgi:flagellar operon protein (TIGR03826 family)